MQKFSTVLLCIILLGIFTITIGQFLPFQFSSPDTASVYYALLAIILPILISVLYYRRKRNKSEYAFIKIWGLISIWLVSFFALSIYWFSHTMCGYGNDRIIFEQKASSSIKILQRSYGCGAYDSEMPKYEFIKIIPLTQWVNYYQEIDTGKIDLKIWKRSNQP